MVFAVLGGVAWADVVDPEAEAFAVGPLHVFMFDVGDTSIVVFFCFGDDDEVVVELDIFEL